MTEFYVQPEVQFTDDIDLLHRPVSAETCIGFEEYSRMQTRVRKMHGARRMAPPPYATSDAALRKVLVAYLERRAFSKTQRDLLHEVAPCSEIQAINRAQQVLLSHRPRKIETLRRLSQEFVALKKKPNPDAKRLKTLQVQIRNVDTLLRIEGNVAALVTGVLYWYYRCGFDSVKVASEAGISPIHIRQLLKRIADTWEEVTGTKIPRVERHDRREPRPCGCGCGRMTKMGRFVPGHCSRKRVL